MGRKAPQSKWSCLNRPNVQNLLVQIDDGLVARIFYVNLDRTIWTLVQWTTYITLIWTVQMVGGTIDPLCYVNLNLPNGQQSNIPPMLHLFGQSKLTLDRWTTVNLDSPPRV